MDVRVDLRDDAVRDVEEEMQGLQGYVDPKTPVFMSTLKLPWLDISPSILGHQYDRVEDARDSSRGDDGREDDAVRCCVQIEELRRRVCVVGND